MTDNAPIETKSGKKDEVTGVNIKVLDDGSFLLRTDNTNYDKCEEYSYDNLDDAFDDVKDMLGVKEPDTREEMSPQEMKKKTMAKKITEVNREGE